MSDTNYIELNESFIKNFLSPLSNVVEKAPFLVKDSTITSSCRSSNGEISAVFSMDIGTNISEERFNVPDLVKFTNLLDKATILEDNSKLIVGKNKLSYKSSKWRFNYHLLSVDLLKYLNLKQSVVDEFNSELTFTLKPEVIRDIVKLKTFHKNKVEKVYLKIIDNSIYACLTDDTIANTDELSVLITDRYDLVGDMSNCIIKFDTIKVLSQHRNAPFKVKCSKNAFLIQTIWNGVTIRYITSKLVK